MARQRFFKKCGKSGGFLYYTDLFCECQPESSLQTKKTAGYRPYKNGRVLGPPVRPSVSERGAARAGIPADTARNPPR